MLAVYYYFFKLFFFSDPHDSCIILQLTLSSIDSTLFVFVFLLTHFDFVAFQSKGKHVSLWNGIFQFYRWFEEMARSSILACTCSTIFDTWKVVLQNRRKILAWQCYSSHESQRFFPLLLSVHAVWSCGMPLLQPGKKQ